MKWAIPVLFAALPAMAQGPIMGVLFPAQLKDYLGLTNAQVDTINRLNLDYNRYAAEKQVRMAQVQRELNVEMRRQQLDPMAVGLRQVELETIRRELQDRLKKTQTDIAAVLNEQQKTKLKALEEAMKLQSLIAQAQCENLLVPQPQPQPSSLPVLRVNPIGGMGDFMGGIIGTPVGAGCRLGVLSNVIPAPQP